VDPDETKKSWDEYVRTIPKMWMEERYGYMGQYVKLPRRAVLPKPYQTPHPPIWAAAASPGTEVDCGDRGIGALFLSFSGYTLQKERTQRYREHIAGCTDPVGAFINDRATVVNFLFCHEDDTYAQATGKRLAISYGETGGQAAGAAELYPTASYSASSDVRAPLRALEVAGGGSPDAQGRGEAYSSSQGRSLRDLYRTEEPKVPEGMCAGNPAHIIEAIKGWEETGVDEVGFLLQSGEIISHEQVMESMRLFGREVMPHFKTDRRAGQRVSAVAAANGGAR
jgi:alkanesulfonate monooxygenase SsuD/methylene tetrahydromethanopterin reductase-like flavin-dependent oxidoreductase (luciferase family)